MKSAKLFTAFTLIILISACLSSPSFADDYSAKLDELMQKFDKIGMFSGVVMLAKDGKPVYEKSFGFADWETKTPNTSATLFNIGSINKMFTHSIINQLENEGKLKKSDNLGKYIKLYNDERDEKIIIQMLIEMKAGLNDYLRNPEYNRNIEKFKTVNDYLELIKNEPLLFEPGTGQEYSNSGYAVLGGIIEKVTGKSYVENLKERFFIPLGMNNTYYRQIGDNISGCAMGTMITFNGNKVSEPFYSMPSPAGGLFMNISDMLKFDNELRKTGVMSLGTRAGGTQVWNSILAQYENGYSLIILSNFSHAAEEVEMRFRDIMNGKDYPDPGYPMQMELYRLLDEKGVGGLEKNFKQALEKSGFEYNDMHLNFFGYELMNSNELDKAIEVFTLNTKLFPNTPNVWDSLGEAYMNKGDNEKAIANYKKVLEMDPENQNAKKMLEKLSK